MNPIRRMFSLRSALENARSLEMHSRSSSPSSSSTRYAALFKRSASNRAMVVLPADGSPVNHTVGARLAALSGWEAKLSGSGIAAEKGIMFKI